MYNEWFHIGPVTIHGYGVMIALGALSGIYLTALRARRRGLSEDTVWTMAVWMLVAGAVGAKLLYLLMHLGELPKDPRALLQSTGFLIYGGIAAGVLAMLLISRRRGQAFLDYFDLYMPGVALAQGIGRLGCFFAGCCYGRPTELPFGLVFPAGSMAPAGVALWPTQLISCLGDLAICALLLCYARRPRRRGSVGLLYLALYGIGRFAVEFIRNDYQAVLGPLSYAQIISLVVTAAAVLLLLLRKNHPLSKKNT